MPLFWMPENEPKRVFWTPEKEKRNHAHRSNFSMKKILQNNYKNHPARLLYGNRHNKTQSIDEMKFGIIDFFRVAEYL